MANVEIWNYPPLWQNIFSFEFNHRLRQNICRFLDCRLSSISSITNQGWNFLCEHKKLALLAFYSVMELGMLISDQFNYGKWGVPLAYFLLSAFLFFAVSNDHYRDRIATETKQQPELQLGELEVSISVLQLVDTFIQFIVTAWSSKFKFRFLNAFPLVFCLHTLIHHACKNYVWSSKDSPPYELNKESPSKEGPRDPPDKQSMPLGTSGRHDEAESRVIEVKNSHVSNDSASSSNLVEIISDDNMRTQTHMSGRIQQLRRRFLHKDDEIGSNYMPSKKYDVSSLKDLPRDFRNDEAMPSTTSIIEGDLTAVMETTVDPPLHSDSVASTNTQDASIDVDMTGTTEAQTDLNNKNLLGIFPIKDDKIASDHWPPQKHDESSDDDSMFGCISAGNHQVEFLRKVIKEDEAGSSHSSFNEHNDESSLQQDPRDPPDNESIPGHTSVKVDQTEITMTPVGHFLMSSNETEKIADEEMLREVKESRLEMLLGKRPRPPIERTTSLSEITFDQRNHQHQNGPVSSTTATKQNQVATGGAGSGADEGSDQRVTPRSNNRRHSADFLESDHFLRSCSLCSRRLLPGRDIYMYRGDSAFCSSECRQQQIYQDEKKESSECRQQQINQDEKKEKCSFASAKKQNASTSGRSQVPTKGGTFASF